MAYIVPVFLAFFLNLCGVSVFYKPSIPGCEPFLPSLIFHLAVTFLILNTEIFSKKWRKLSTWGEYIYEFCISLFIMEVSMNNFWFLLEAKLMTLISKCNYLFYGQKSFQDEEWQTLTKTQCFQLPLIYLASSYALSSFFLFSILHMTRYIDLGLIRNGSTEFFSDILSRVKRAFLLLTRSQEADEDVNDFECQRSYSANSCNFQYNLQDAGDGNIENPQNIRRRHFEDNL